MLNRSVLSIALATLCTLTASNSSASAQVDALLQDAILQKAKGFEAAADYQNAFVTYREYLLNPAPKSAARRHARLKLPVLQEAVKYGASPELSDYLAAMDLRAEGKVEAADAKLKELLDLYPGGQLADDALYLRAYIALMDYYEYQRASEILQTLRTQYPESRYVDTTLFAEAIAQEQLGNSDAAIAKMRELRDRHTGLSVAGISWARDEYLSRLWFERSTSRIEYLEKRNDIATQLISMTPYQMDGYQWQIELVVANQDFTLLVNESDAINDISVKGDSATEMKVNAYSGVVMGEHDSWARVTIDNNVVRGMISTYNERHELIPVTSGGTLSDFHTLLLGDENGNVTDEPDHTLQAPKSQDKANDYLRSIRGVSDVQLVPGEVSQVAMLGVVIDSKFNNYHNGRGVQEAMAILNTTDGIFREQLGIALKIKTPIIVTSGDNDPMNLGSVTMETMMRNFKDYRVASNDLGSDIGLATLFSGNKNSDSALGLAWIGSACRTDGFDVSVVTPYKMPSLLSTHEIGHTMGAPHDSDTACSSQNRHIMWPFLSSNSGRTFSSCSMESITQTMASNNCHVEAMDLELTLDDINDGRMQITIANLDTQRATPSAAVKLSAPSIGAASSSNQCAATNGNNLECNIGALSPRESITLEFEFAQPLSSTDKVVANVIGNGFVDVERHNNSITTDIDGNIITNAGPISDDALTWDTTSGTGYTSNGTGTASGQATGGTSGSGLLKPTSLIVLTIFCALRRRKFNRT